MAYGNPGNPGGGQDADMFSDGPAPAGEEKHSEAGEATGILPKALMAGKDFKVGEEIVLKIVAIHENDFEVEYASEDKGEKSEGGEGYGESEAAPAPSGGEMASMME